MLNSSAVENALFIGVRGELYNAHIKSASVRHKCGSPNKYHLPSYAYAIQTLSYDLSKQSRKVGYLDNLLQGGWGPNVQNIPAFSL